MLPSLLVAGGLQPRTFSLHYWGSWGRLVFPRPNRQLLGTAILSSLCPTNPVKLAQTFLTFPDTCSACISYFGLSILGVPVGVVFLFDSFCNPREPRE